MFWPWTYVRLDAASVADSTPCPAEDAAAVPASAMVRENQLAVVDGSTNAAANPAAVPQMIPVMMSV